MKRSMIRFLKLLESRIDVQLSNEAEDPLENTGIVCSIRISAMCFILKVVASCAKFLSVHHDMHEDDG